MAEEYKGISLNKLVASVLKKVQSVSDKDILLSKLKDYNYAYHPKYDEFVYELRATDEYRVNDTFPRISRTNIPAAIAKASFDLILAEILPYKK
jgi:hypothetical protein